MEEKKFDEITGKIDPDTLKATFDDIMKTRKEYEEKYAGMFRWKTGEMFYATVMKDLDLSMAYYGPRIFNYVLTFDRNDWCIHKGQLVLEKEGYVGKIISIEIR